MLTGEFNYEEHLYPVDRDDEENRYYYQIVFLLYILFCILMTILIINLLIASAVGEIPPLLEQAHVKYSIMRLKLIMDYEIFLSTWSCLFPALKQRVRRLIEINQMETVYPNQVYRQNYKYYSIKKFFQNQ